MKPALVSDQVICDFMARITNEMLQNFLSARSEDDRLIASRDSGLICVLRRYSNKETRPLSETNGPPDPIEILMNSDWTNFMIYGQPSLDNSKIQRFHLALIT
jgi:hypothetical protein